MPSIDLHLAMHGVGQQPWFKLEVLGPNGETLVECDLKLAYESGDLSSWTVSSGKDHLKASLKPEGGNQHLSYKGKVDVGHSDGIIRITRHGIGSMWLVINGDESRKLAASWNPGHQPETRDERRFEGGAAK